MSNAHAGTRSQPLRPEPAHAAFALLLAFAATSSAARELPPTVTISVDASDAPRRIIHARLRVPARPGPLTLLYPRWIPGEHGPTGAVEDIAGLRLSAGGRAIPWRRDPLDMFAFHCDVPAGADAVEVELDYLSPSSLRTLTSGSSVTPHLAVINWHQLLLYPAGTPSEQSSYVATLRLPRGWGHATALPLARDDQHGTLTFQPVSLATLVDSPVLAGEFFRTVALGPSEELDVAADSRAALEVPPDWQAGLKRLVEEAHALFGGAHYRDYHFLLALSDHVAHFGLEHHQSSDDRIPEGVFLDDDMSAYWARLLPHELVHSWNGKYRRPRPQVASDYQAPRDTELLWVYEGLTAYLGDVLAVRSGLWSPSLLRGRLAEFAAVEAHQAGRAWRPLADTAVAAQRLYGQESEGSSWRRRNDYYSEGELLWLEVDATIRERSGGRHSLDDFCRRFFGGSGDPMVAPYSIDDLIAALDRTEPFEWRSFFSGHLDRAGGAPPVGGIEESGWRLAYTEDPDDYPALVQRLDADNDLRFSLGFRLDEDGAIGDVLPDSPAARAGVLPASRVVAVNRRRYTPSRMRAALLDARRSPGPIALLVEHDETFADHLLDYHGGARHPRLEREPDRPDRLADILRPRARPTTRLEASSATPSSRR